MSTFEQVLVLLIAVIASAGFVYLTVKVIIKSAFWVFQVDPLEYPGRMLAGMGLGLLTGAPISLIRLLLVPWLDKLGVSYAVHYLNYGVVIVLAVVGSGYAVLLLSITVKRMWDCW